MSTAKIISVNPGVKTRGAIFEEGKRYAKAGKTMITGAVKRHSSTNFVDFITGIPKTITRRISAKLLAVRVICGVIFIATALHTLLTGLTDTVSVLALAVGISMVAGFLTRLCSLAGATAFSVITYLMAESAGVMTAESYLMAAFAAGCLMVAVMGPGLFSIDQIIRYLISGPRRRLIRRPETDGRRSLTYRAYWN